MNRKLSLTFIVPLLLLSLSVVTVLAEGTIHIHPPWPAMSASPATFEVWVPNENKNTGDVHVFLAMTETCKDALSGPVEITYDGGSQTIAEGEWIKETGASTPLPPGVPAGIRYNAANLRSHLGVVGEDIWWVFKVLPSFGEITPEHKVIEITLPSSDPRMLVYLIGKIGESEEFDNRIPQTNAGFVVPEPATIAVIATSMVSLAIARKLRK